MLKLIMRKTKGHFRIFTKVFQLLITKIPAL